MSYNLQKKLNELKPYVIGIRFVEGSSVVDTVLKDGWKVPPSNIILTGKVDDSPTYHMFYSENDNIGIDELLEFIGETIKINIEREKKFQLLHVKVKELETFFKNNPLSKLKNMKFVLGESPIIPENITDNFLIPDYTIDSLDNDDFKVPPIKDEGKTVDTPIKEIENQKTTNFIGESNPTYEENAFTAKFKNQEIELPPKGVKIQVEDFEPVPMSMECKHPPDKFCPNCIDY